jgi:hypothetical protein
MICVRLQSSKHLFKDNMIQEKFIDMLFKYLLTGNAKQPMYIKKFQRLARLHVTDYGVRAVEFGIVGEVSAIVCHICFVVDVELNSLSFYRLYSGHFVQY